MQGGSIWDIYACVAEYCLDDDDRDAAVDAPERAPMTRPFWALLTGYLFQKPA